MSNRGQRPRIRTQREASAWRAVRQRIGFRGLPHVRQNGLFLFIALMRMVTFRMKVVYKLSVWALRACSYKTRAEDWAVGHRPPSSSRGLFWFLSCLQQWVQEVRWVQEVQGVRGIFLTTVFLISSLLFFLLFSFLSFSSLSFPLPHNITSLFHISHAHA